MGSIPALPSFLRRDRRAMVAMEFAIVTPVLTALLIAALDLSNAFVTARRLTVAADQVAQVAMVEAAQSQTLNLMTADSVWRATTAAFAIFPNWAHPKFPAGFSITLTDIAFSAKPAGCTSGCTYTAHVAWSASNSLGRPKPRACGTVAAVPNDQYPSLTTLPQGDFGASSVLVADVSTDYQPSFVGFVTGTVAMMQSAYLSAASSNGVNLVPGPAALVTNICPGVSG